MRRVIVFFQWKVKWWLDLCLECQHLVLSNTLSSGLIAYANKQATLYQDLALHFVELWYPLVKDPQILASWKNQYPNMQVKDYKKHNVDIGNNID